MENNNRNNGRGIFYGVIGVATLVVAIIGATFAYFSASVTGTNNMLTGSTTLSLNYDVVSAAGLKTDLIPIELDGKDGSGVAYTGDKITNFPVQYGTEGSGFSALPGITATSCKDSNNNSVCSVYSFKIQNPSETVAQTVYGSITVHENGFENLHYAVFVGDDTQITNNTKKYNVLGEVDDAQDYIGGLGKTEAEFTTGGLIVKGTKVPAIGQRTEWGKASSVLLYPDNAKETRMNEVTYTIVFWLEETGEPQAEQGKTFNASITFDTGTGTGTTGVIRVS